MGVVLVVLILLLTRALKQADAASADVPVAPATEAPPPLPRAFDWTRFEAAFAAHVAARGKDAPSTDRSAET